MKHLVWFALLASGLLISIAAQAVGQVQPQVIQSNPGNPQHIPLNHPWHGTLREGDQRDKVRGTFCTVCLVALEEGKHYQIDMQGHSRGNTYPRPDAYLRLEDPDGRHLDSNDDAFGAYGTTLNARIVFPCKVSGQYRIIATTFDGGTGSYTLQVTETGTAITNNRGNAAAATGASK